jgi:radical SAM superfamily enzyme YgiQ (UPF0313 family)
VTDPSGVATARSQLERPESLDAAVARLRDLGDDGEMVRLAAESGCVSVFVGMESLDEDCLEETNKPFNRVQKFEAEINMFHDNGIMVNPGIVFGFDNDDESVFERAVDFLVKTRVELAYVKVLTPLPGTALYERYNSSGRIFDRDWAKYDGKHVVFYPSRMSPEQLQEGFYWANHQFYSIPSIWNSGRRLPLHYAAGILPTLPSK